MPVSRTDYRYWLTIPTRWMDNDIYGHVNNVIYYSWFDTVINRFLIEQGGLDIHSGAVVGYCVESQCRYFKPFVFPEPVEAGLRVAHLGRSSVRYEIGLFGEDEVQARAEGHFVHVFVDRSTNLSMPIPESIRKVLEGLRSA